MFALEEDDDREEEMLQTVVDRQQCEHTEGGGTTSSLRNYNETFAIARRMGYEMRPIAHRLDAPRRGRSTAPGGPCSTTPGPNVLAVVSWDTHKFAAPNRTHLFHSGRTDGLTGRMDHSDVMEDPHRETKYRPGPNPHWPVCHRFGPRFIINRHPRYSPG